MLEIPRPGTRLLSDSVSTFKIFEKKNIVFDIHFFGEHTLSTFVEACYCVIDVLLQTW